jgi:hypothetical protein
MADCKHCTSKKFSGAKRVQWLIDIAQIFVFLL